MGDLGIIAGGKVRARDRGARVEAITPDDLGTADRVKTSSSYTSIIRGGGDHAAIASRRAQVQRQYEASPPNIDQDKLRERLAKLSGGTAILYAGGVTPVERVARSLLGGSQRCICASTRLKQAGSSLQARQRALSLSSVN